MNENAPNANTEDQVAVPLPTELRKCLQEAHEVLDAHAAHLPSAMLNRLQELQDSFSEHHIRIAVCGEVKAGKSTLLNAIAGTTLSPVAFAPLTNTPLRVTHGANTVWRLGNETLAGLADLEARMRAEDAGSDEVVVETNLDLLRLGGQVELLDTPGLGSDARLDSISAEALRALDAIILVVRYPGLFTEFTRRLASSLSHDISKLFVVWNLDGSCTNLSDADRTLHANTLRNNLAGANDVFFVDANQACTTRGADPDPSGLWYLTNALRAFLGSHSRELVALREAAKGAEQLIAKAQEALAERHAAVTHVLDSTRRQLAEIDARASSAIDRLRGRGAEVETAAAAAVARAQTSTRQAHTKLRKALRQARRRWTWNGSLSDLDAAVAKAGNDYANGVAQACEAARSEMQDAAASVDAPLSRSSRPPTWPSMVELAPGGRGTLGATGNWQRIRRLLWRGWYLEGLKHLEEEWLGGDIAEQSDWLETTRDKTCQSVRAATERKIQDVQTQAAADKVRISEETQLTSYEEEAAQLERDSPTLAAALERIVAVARRARNDL